MNYIQIIFTKQNTGKILSDMRYMNSAMSLKNLILFYTVAKSSYRSTLL